MSISLLVGSFFVQGRWWLFWICMRIRDVGETFLHTYTQGSMGRRGEEIKDIRALGWRPRAVLFPL